MTARRDLILPILQLAAERDGVLTRDELRRLEVNRWDVRRELRAGRWRLAGRHCLISHTGPLPREALWRIALAEVRAHAALDGVTALFAAGLTGYSETTIHVSVPRGACPEAFPGVAVHETRRRCDDDVMVAGIRRVRPAVAAVRAALWAPSDRQAALLVVMAVQQRLTTGAALAEAMTTIRRDKRRDLLRAVVADVADGCHALGELDFIALCRQRRIPLPARQVVRTGPRGRAYLDCYWDDCNLVVEVEGIHHGAAETQVEDAFRQNAMSAGGATWLRIPVLGLRVDPDGFMAQVVAARRRLGAG